MQVTERRYQHVDVQEPTLVRRIEDIVVIESNTETIELHVKEIPGVIEILQVFYDEMTTEELAENEVSI